jgi:hypothetical protein
LAHAVLWEYSYERLELAQLLGQLAVFLTWPLFGVFFSTVEPHAPRFVTANLARPCLGG